MAYSFGPVRGPQCFRADEGVADWRLTVLLVVCAALAAWKVLDLMCLMVRYICAQRTSRTTQPTIRENDNGHGKPATTTQVDLGDRGSMTGGHMLDPREMTVAVVPDGARFHYRKCW